MKIKDEWLFGGACALILGILGYDYITKQKAGGCPKCGATQEQMQQKKEEEGGCGCGMDAQQQQQ